VSQALAKALMAFVSAMLVRLIQKSNQGFTGWDSLNEINLINRMKDKVDAVSDRYVDMIMINPEIEKKDLVDIANFAMMLWNRHDRKH
jgi:hypothetical protein